MSMITTAAAPQQRTAAYHMARRLLWKGGMRALFGFLIIGVAAGVMFERNQVTPPPAAAAPTTLPAPPPPARPTSPHNWAKHSLDRVGEVKDQVATQRRQNDQP